MKKTAISEATEMTARRASADLSVIILTFNEEVNLPACLDSLCGLKCRLFVVDSGSTDKTIEIAKAAGAVIDSHPFLNYALQRNWALENLELMTTWVLNLDADERLTPELVAEINATVERPPENCDGFLFRKRTVFMGRWIRHGGHYPSYHLRLFRRSRGRCEDRMYDQHFVVDGNVLCLKNDYIDVVGSKLSTWSARHIRWAEMEVQEMTGAQSQGRQVKADARGDPVERRRWWRKTYGQWPLFGRAFFYWFYRYFLRFGFLDGKEGLIFHFLQGFWFRFLVDAMIYERRAEPGSRSSSPSSRAGL